MMNFIKTTDKETAEKLMAEGFKLISQSGSMYTFLNQPSKQFDFNKIDNKKVVYDNKLSNFDEVCHYHVGSSIIACGKLVKSNGKQAMELKIEEIELVGDAPADYPIQAKRHTMEFLRSVSYMRGRTKTFQAVFRVRSVAAFAIHDYFQKNNNN